MKIPRPLKNLIDSFERLPGIGPKTASRLAFYLLHVPQDYLEKFAESLVDLKKKTTACSICFNIGEEDPCPICADRDRDKSVICVVEMPLDILALERTGHYQGVYHVLGGAISPLNNIGPDELYIDQLLTRLENSEVKELILATNPNMEGEATAMYLKKKIQEIGVKTKLTRIGLGLPTGGDLEYADETTLTRAIEGRRDY